MIFQSSYAIAVLSVCWVGFSRLNGLAIGHLILLQLRPRRLGRDPFREPSRSGPTSSVIKPRKGSSSLQGFSFKPKQDE